ncbi:MAG TPA: pitrilysin family protein [Candidatus Limnocylindria bacterium]|nr:pitrilysin family protein [Candidatus Limnocylindria bacterium]
MIHALEARHAPVVSLWVWYHVGGRDEVPGTTGMSHFLEHMLFKGTPKHPKGDLDRLLARYGAQWNAFTNEDVTCYFETVPRDRYAVALELEADRMRNALISAEEVEAERTVIVSEREGYENDPSFLLGESLQAVAFDRHPYGQGVIGSKYEIKLMTRAGLYEHYRAHYAPNNAYVIVVGDDRAESLVEQAAAAFGGIAAEPLPVRAQAPEPPPLGEKRLVVHRAGGALPIVQLGFHTAAGSDPRAPALQALAVALAGGSGGDAASGRSSRLYRGLVEKELATEIDATFGLTKEPFLFTIEATVRPGVSHRAVEEALLAELGRLADEPIGEAEFGRIRRGLLASVAFPSDTITWRAFRLGSLLSSGAAPSIGAWYDALAKVTPDDVQRAARETFVERSRTVGHFIPEAG